VCTLDRHTIQEISIISLCLIPIIIAALVNGPVAGDVVCLLSSLSWLVAAFQGNIYIYTMSPRIGMFARSLMFALIVFLLALYQHTIRRSQEQLQRLKCILPICSDFGRILYSNGQWRDLEGLLESNTATVFTSTSDCHH
jgi:hypothetical protein